MILLSGCVHGQSNKPRVTVQPTANFYATAAKEFDANKNGPACVEIAKDWMAFTAPVGDKP